MNLTAQQFWTRLLRDAWLAGVPAADVVEATARLALLTDGEVKARPFDEPPQPTNEELEQE